MKARTLEVSVTTCQRSRAWLQGSKARQEQVSVNGTRWRAGNHTDDLESG